MSRITRRTVLKSAAALGAPLAFPYLNLAHAQGAPIPIGVGLPLTGKAGAYGPDRGEAAKRTAAKIHAAGGVLGRKLELFIEDSESSAAVAANLTQKFINVHKAQSCIGYWGTPEGMSSRPIAVQNKVVLMVSSAANAITEGDTQGYVWRFQMKATDWGIVISRATIDKLGFKSVGVLGLQNAFVLPIMKVFEENMRKAGRQVVDSLIYNPEQPSYRAEVERVFGKKPEAVYCFGLLPDFVSIMKEVYRGGFESKVVALTIMADAEGKFVQAVGNQVAEGIRHFQPMPDVSAPGYKKFLQLMGAPADRVLLFPPNTHDQLAITALAMEKAKSPMAVDWSKQIIPVGNGPGQEVDDVVDALKLVREGKPVNFQGAGSTCDFTPNGDQMGRGMGQWIIKGGKSVFVEYAKP
jgi:branched-chain amino acid transport system substrate-binding protein